MRNSEIENWVLSIADGIRAKRPVEDSRVELKATFIEPLKSARRIAGHANAARGEPILWVIGIDEKASAIPGVRDADFASWWAQVNKEFDGIAPSVVDLAVHVGQSVVVALLFDTSRAPFVVRNPHYGSVSGENVRWETPWREGTAIRSAGRADLIRLLVPAAALPAVKTRDGSIQLHPPGKTGAELHLELILYLTPANEKRLTIPFHECKVQLGLPTERFDLSLSEPMLTPRRAYDSQAGVFVEGSSTSLTVDGSSSEVILRGPGEVLVRSNALVDFKSVAQNDALRMFVTMRPVWSDIDISVVADFRRTGAGKFGVIEWQMVATAF